MGPSQTGSHLSTSPGSAAPSANGSPSGQFVGLQHPGHAIDRFQRFDILAAVGRLQLLEPARLDQHVTLERSDGLVVGLEARLEARPERVEMAAEHADRRRTGFGRGR